MENTILIEQTAKNIKLVEAIVLAVRFASIATGLDGLYLSLTPGNRGVHPRLDCARRLHDRRRLALVDARMKYKQDH